MHIRGVSRPQVSQTAHTFQPVQRRKVEDDPSNLGEYLLTIRFLSGKHVIPLKSVSGGHGVNDVWSAEEAVGLLHRGVDETR